MKWFDESSLSPELRAISGNEFEKRINPDGALSVKKDETTVIWCRIIIPPSIGSAS